MKKTLEDELMSLAHRILQLRGRADIEEMKTVARELYEKLIVLSFTERHFEGSKPTIGRKNIERALQEENKKSEQILDYQEEINKHKKTSSDSETVTDLNSEKQEDKEEITESKPDPLEKKPQQILKKSYSEENDLRHIAVHYDDLPQFEPLSPLQNTSKLTDSQNKTSTKQTEKKTGEEPIDNPKKSSHEEVKDQPQVSSLHPDLFSTASKNRTRNDLRTHKKSLNERLNKGLKFGLNDRLAFINHLFEGSSTDFNRVVSQLNTFENYSQAKAFIEETVKPDYNWEDQEVYEKRFYIAVEKRLEQKG